MEKLLQNSRWIHLLTFLALTLVVRASDTNRYSGEIWSPIDAQKTLATAAEITKAKYPDSDQAIIEDKMLRVYRGDGTGESQEESFVKVLSEKGKRASRTIRMPYMLPYMTVEIIKVEVVKPDGTAESVDVAANSKDSIDDSSMSMNIYDPNEHVLQINIPKLDVGDVVHSITRTTTERPFIPGAFAEQQVFESDGYIRHLSYEVHAPADRPLQSIRLRAEIPGTVTYQTVTNADGAVTHLWEAANVPRMFEEPAMPPAGMVLQRLYVSTLPDWKAVSNWYWDLSKSHLEATSPEMKNSVAELTTGAKTDMDKIKAIFYKVSKNIRYMGLTPEKDRPGFEPHDVKLTFEKNYGVCRDKAALLVSMLREAGLPAYPVLINVGTKRDPEVADPDFNHAIVCVELEKGKYQLMDPTDENTRDLLPTSDQNQSYLVCKPDGENLAISPVDSPDNHLMRASTTGTLTAVGTLEAKSVLIFEGVNDDAYRNAFVSMKPDDLRRFFERDLKSAIPGAKLKSLKMLPENMLDMSSNLRAELEFSAEGVNTAGNGKSIVSLPWIGSGVGIINFILRDTGLEKRKYPLETGTTCGLVETLSLKLDEGFTGVVSLPQCQAVDDECLLSHQQYDFKNQSLECSREFKMKTVEFSPAQYAELKQTLKNLEYDRRKAPVMTVAANAETQPATAPKTAEAPVESDAKILVSDKKLDVIDAHTATLRVKYKKEILSYNGKKREAELKIDFNPACQQAKIIRAVVTSKTGSRAEISPNEINVMDAGWNSGAKRYTGGKILVANLPSVEIGSTIEVEYEVSTTNKPFLAGFDSFQFADALVAKSVVLTAPDSLKLETMTSGPKGIVTAEKKSSGGKTTWTWSAANVAARPAETQLPPEWTFSSAAGYCIGNMNDYSRQLREVLLNRSQKNIQTAKLAQQFAEKSGQSLETVKAIRDYVAKTIRNAGPTFTELPLTELSAADTTLADGYGHQADRAILLHAMLTAAGFKPEFVLASDLPPVAEITRVAGKFPLPQYFQAVLVRVKVNGETYYLNDTDQYSHLGSTRYDGKLAMVPGKGGVQTIHATKDSHNRGETIYSLKLADDGKSRFTVTQHFYGIGFNAKDRYFSELPPEERHRYFQEIVAGISQSAQPVGDLLTDFDHYPGTEQFTIEVDRFAVVDGKYFYFDLPFIASLYPSGADRRTLPMLLGEQGEEKIRTEIELPPGFQHAVIEPGIQNLDTPAGGAHIAVAHSSRKCSLDCELTSKPAVISPQDYPMLLKTEAKLRQKSARVFLLEKTN